MLEEDRVGVVSVFPGRWARSVELENSLHCMDDYAELWFGRVFSSAECTGWRQGAVEKSRNFLDI